MNYELINMFLHFWSIQVTEFGISSLTGRRSYVISIIKPTRNVTKFRRT